MPVMSKAKFITKLRRGVPSVTGSEPELAFYDSAAAAAEQALARMPGIGFASNIKRFEAFVAVCRHLDLLAEQGTINEGDAQLALLILRASNKPFLKAATAFDFHGLKLKARDRGELPDTAREYLAGLRATQNGSNECRGRSVVPKRL